MSDSLKSVTTLARDFLITRWYFLFLVILGLFMEGVALYWQYVVGDEPCQICIHVRVWVAAFTLLGLVFLCLPRNRWLYLAGHALAIGAMVGLWERCRYLLDVENGKGESSCSFFLGFPDWFALDRWMPWMFEVRNLCGFTPEMWFGVSMAQYLIVASTALVLFTTLAFLVNVLAWRD